MKKLGILVAGLAMAACGEQSGIAGRAHTLAAVEARGLEAAVAEAHVVPRESTRSAYCLACHVEVDLANSHPVGRSYADAAGVSPGMYYVPPAPGIVLVDGEDVECTSCHDDGSSGNPFLLAVPQLGFCDACHRVDGTDTGSPTATLTAPADGATVQGTIRVDVTVADDYSVSRVELWIGTLVASVRPTTPALSFPVDTTQLPDGPATIQLRAYDSAGRVATAAVTVLVANAPPPPPDVAAPEVVIGAPAAGAALRGIAAVSAAVSDDVGVASVELWAGPSAETATRVASTTPVAGAAALALDTTTLADGPQVAVVVARDAAGNAGSAAIAIVVDNGPPAVAISAPAAGAVVRSALVITANASDAITGVASVDFYVDGLFLARSTAAPFFAPWTPTRRSGLHTLTAVATDAAGNRATSAPVTVDAK